MADPEAPTASVDPVGGKPGDPIGGVGNRLDLHALEEAQSLVGTRYRLERLVGKGGMGRVFGATDTVLRRRVAIKLQRRIATGSVDSASRQVIAEARAMAGLHHRNVCRILEVVLEAPSPFIVMDWVEGIDLRRHWRTLDLSARLSVFASVVDAVAAAHGAGLIHGDIKPENILVEKGGEPVLVDFGLARSRLGDGTVASPGGGTPGYAAPEQWEDEPISPSADVYALGVLLYEMLTDRLPFEGGSALEVCERAKADDPPLPQELAPECPEGLQRICLVAFERDPAGRYPDAGAMARDLARYQRGETVAARPSFLMSRFAGQVQHQIDRVGEWARVGMVTRGEAETLTARLRAVLQPESSWIVDSRRLTASQVSLYLGGWLVVLALSVGLWFSWGSLEVWHRLAVPWGATLALVGAGVVLDCRDRRRAGLVYLVTGSLALPVAVWVLLRETGLLGAEMEDLEFLDLQGFMNRQLLTIACAWLAAALAFRMLTKASAFVLFAVVACALAWDALWLSLGRFSGGDRLTLAEVSIWTGALGALLIPLGLWINRAEEETARRLGPASQRQRDAWPVLAGGVVLLVLGLSSAAYHAPERYLFQPVDLDWSFIPSRWQAVAFAINGVVLQLVSLLLERRRTALRTRLAGVLRWIIPSHFLGALLALEVANGFDLWRLWLTLLAVGSVAVVLLSVPKQWKPFLVTGLAYLAVWYVRAFLRAREHLDEPGLVYGVLMFSLLGVGAVIMGLALRVPQRSLQRQPSHSEHSMDD